MYQNRQKLITLISDIIQLQPTIIYNQDDHKGSLKLVNREFTNQYNLQIAQNIHDLCISHCKLQSKIKIEGKTLLHINLQKNKLRLIPLISSPILRTLDLRHNQLQLAQIAQLSTMVDLQKIYLDNNPIHMFNNKLLQHSALKHSLIQILTQQQLNQIIHSHNQQQYTTISLIITLDLSEKQLLQLCNIIIKTNYCLLLQLLLPRIHQNILQYLIEVIMHTMNHNMIATCLRFIDNIDGYNRSKYFIQRFKLMDISLIYFHHKQLITLQTLIQILYTTNNTLSTVYNLIDHLTDTLQIQFISCEIDLFRIIKISSNKMVTMFRNICGYLLLKFKNFFYNYSFKNRDIINYLLKLYHPKLLFLLLKSNYFRMQIFNNQYYKFVVKSNQIVYKILNKAYKIYIQEQLNRNTLNFSEYQQHQHIILTNDLYDYEVLRQYQMMQSSFIYKNYEQYCCTCPQQRSISLSQQIKHRFSRSNSNLFHQQKNQKIKNKHDISTKMHERLSTIQSILRNQ